MDIRTVRAAIRWVRDEGLLEKRLDVLWHAGEPLLAGIPFYREAHKVFAEEVPADVHWTFAFQTNGTLINREWASFFRESRADIGISIDGPREWHDARRKSASGRGSFDDVARGIEHLRSHGVKFGTISVLGREALEQPEVLYEFLRDLGVDTCGFSAEEVEGVHLRSEQFQAPSPREDAVRFYRGLFELAERTGDIDRVRELSKALVALAHHRERASGATSSGRLASDMLDPFRILSIAHDGRISTFAPELMGHAVEGIGEFTFGNVHHNRLAEIIASERFQLASRLIALGADRCSQSCEYYGLCGGGSPSNKYFENGRLDSTETEFCRVAIMAPVDAILEQLELRLD